MKKSSLKKLNEYIDNKIYEELGKSIIHLEINLTKTDIKFLQWLETEIKSASWVE